MELRVLTALDVERALPMDVAIEGMKQAFAQFSASQVDMPMRSRIQAGERGVALFMPALARQTQDLALKVVSVFPANQKLGKPTIHALVVALRAETGEPIALLEGAALTAIRTGAASGPATDLLARPQASQAAIFGSGAQARTQLLAICTVRPIQRAWIYSLDRPGAQAFIAQMAGRGPIPQDLRLANSPREAVSQADIICTATTSNTPVFAGEDLQPGTHINAIGSFTPTMQEIDLQTLQRSLVVVDSRQAVLAEAGDLIVPIQAGQYEPQAIHAELGEIVLGERPGRRDPQQITLFKSVGLAVQDAVAAGLALRRAAKAGIGTVIRL